MNILQTMYNTLSCPPSFTWDFRNTETYFLKMHVYRIFPLCSQLITFLFQFLFSCGLIKQIVNTHATNNLLIVNFCFANFQINFTFVHFYLYISLKISVLTSFTEKKMFLSTDHKTWIQLLWQKVCAFYR